MTQPIRLIVGLANPGTKYAGTRHNVGAWYLDALARSRGVVLSEDRKSFGLTGRFDAGGETVRLLVPLTYMNLSGQATSAVAGFFRIPVESMLVAHDDLDLPPGRIRLRRGGGHGGHNGLRDIVSRHGNNKNFVRLRIGIGHPGDSSQVTPWVLGKPQPEDREKMEAAIDEAVSHTDEILGGDIDKAMNALNGFRA